MWVSAINCICGHGVTLNENGLALYDTAEEIRQDNEEDEAEGMDMSDFYEVKVYQHVNGDWLDEFNFNWSEVARIQMG